MRPNDSGKMRKYDNNNVHNNVSKNLNKERFAYVMTCLIGNEVTVHMKDGNEVKGLFHAYNCTNKNDRGDKHGRGGGVGGGANGGEKGEKNDRQEKHEIDISLNYGRVLPKNDKVSGPINKAMIIPENNYKAIIGKDIKLDLKDPDEVKSRKEKFKIDADISEKKKNANSVNRELKRWMCDDDDTFDDNKLKLDKTAEPWDQFEQNRKMYGVTTTYKEEIYTTNLDINKVPHHVKIHADKIAKELEKRGMHLDPEDAERDNKNLDEEDLFGAVRTNAKEKYNKNQKYKKEETKPKTYQGKFHPLVIKDLKEKIQSVKKENEKKYPNKQKPESCEPSSSNDDTNSTANANANRKTKLPSTPKKENSQNSDFIGINALNLEPAMPKLDDKTRSEWIIFKNKVKNKTVNKKDKNADKLEFMTAAKEFNERLAGKMNLKNKEPSSRPAKEHSLAAQTTSSNQKNVSTSTYKSKHAVNGSENKPPNNNVFTNPGNINYNTNNVIMNNPNMRPHDFYMYNCNTFNNMKNNMMPHNIDFYPNMPMIPDSQNQMYHYGEHMYKHESMNPVYSYGGHMGGFRPNFPLNLPIFPQNMKMGEILVSDLHSSPNAQTKDSSNDELIPFPLKIRENKVTFSDFIAGVLNYSKKENCVECEIGFKSTYQFSYKNVLGEIPPYVPLNYLPPPATGYPNNMTPLEPPVPNSNIANVPINYQFIPIMPPNMNNANPYMENPVYMNPFYPNFYSNNNNSYINDNNINANTNNSVTNNITRGNSSSMPYMYNIPGSTMENNYSSNKNMNMYPIRNPLHFHAGNNMNFPLSSCIPPPHMNYPLNNSAMGIINNPNMPNSNMNMTPYPSDMVLMHPQKFANTNLDPNQNHSQNENPSHNFNQNPNQNSNHKPNQNPNANMNPNTNPNQNANPNPNINPNLNPNLNPNPNLNANPNTNINSLASAQPIHPQFMPPYPYPNYYTPSHGVN